MNAPERVGAQAGFVPDLEVPDAVARHWARCAMLRLRRELCWRWHLQDLGAAPDGALARAVDLSRLAGARSAFMEDDATAAYLTREISGPPPAAQGAPRGSFGWVVEALELEPPAAFLLGLGLLAALDHGAAAVIAACDPRRSSHPTLGLAQLLWDRPAEMPRHADAGHPLWRSGLLAWSGGEAGAGEWERPFIVPSTVASPLAGLHGGIPWALERIARASDEAGPAHEQAAARLRAAARGGGLRVVPLCGGHGADFEGHAAAVSAAAGRALRRLRMSGELRAQPQRLRATLAAAWLNDLDVLLLDDTPAVHGPEAPAAFAYLNELRDIPATVFVPVEQAAALAGVASSLRLPAVEIAPLGYEARLDLWRRLIAPEDGIPEETLAECARRFRFEPLTVRAAAEWLHESRERGPAALTAACRAAAPLETGGLAERVEPRFAAADLVLEPALRRQFDEIRRAMQSLADVHYRWGTARAWNEGGLGILLSGPPGVGKSMFAEALAHALDLPLYRIDLSQVVNKYVGETEKNLKRLFDAADAADAILFFDEADAIFGKRIDVRDAHDRYANLEVSYLLARVERFKGLAVLATNRRRDLDEAFLRRLRAVVEIPMPEAAQRTEIWRKAVPGGADGSALDFDFLGRQFNLSGGHIRSAMLNACLQSAAGQRHAERPRLEMAAVVEAVKREMDKMKRTATAAQFGPFAQVVREMDRA